MSRVITFSMFFPSYHPKAGQPTYFVEKIITTLIRYDAPGYTTETLKECRDKGILDISVMDKLYSLYQEEKSHTIRAGHRFKVGDKFSPRVWSGKPYNSKQIVLGPDIEVKKVWRLGLFGFGQFKDVQMTIDGQVPKQKVIPTVAQNDGLDQRDFTDWFCETPEFKKTRVVDAQIICWNDKIEYLR